MSPKSVLSSGVIGALTFVEGDHYLSKVQKAKPTHKELRDFLFDPEAPHDMEAVLARYAKITKGVRQLHLAPNEPTFMQKLIWPLRHAKASYVLGNYLGTVALCGMVCEMLAILLHEMVPTRIGGEPLSKDGQKQLFSRNFEQLPQSRRLDVLAVTRTITKDQRRQLGDVAGVRNKYLHAISMDADQLPNDAAKVLRDTSSLVVDCLGCSDHGGVFRFHPLFMEYLRNKDMLRPAGQENQ